MWNVFLCVSQCQLCASLNWLSGCDWSCVQIIMCPLKVSRKVEKQSFFDFKTIFTAYNLIKQGCAVPPPRDLGFLITVSLSVLRKLERYTLLKLFTCLHVLPKPSLESSPKINLPLYSLKGWIPVSGIDYCNSCRFECAWDEYDGHDSGWSAGDIGKKL